MSDEGRQFVDTNVLVYAHDSSAGAKGERARDLIDRLWDEGSGCVSIQVLQEFYVTTTRKLKRVLEPGEAAAIVSDLCAWRLHCPDGNDVRAGIGVQRDHQIAFWDAMILHSAAELGCRTVWSEDLNDRQEYGPVVVRNPFS